ncbi:MAG: threonine--tRNA ligase, partial [Patescibacteria group bacterium]
MKQETDLGNLRHSLAHLLAAAVLELYPGTRNTIGPAIDNGFYYDFEFKSPISDADLSKIEKKMREILKSWKEFTSEEKSEKEAKTHFEGNEYKIELIEEIEEKKEKITFYICGNFTDLCRGGHVENPAKEIAPDAFKLDRVAGAYWRGDEKNKMLTRIYGLAFETKEELDAYIKQREEAEKRDHKKLGKELDLFVFSELVGSGLPLWTPKGTILRNLLDDFVWELRKKRGYEKVEIPHITKKELYEKSGHWDKFKTELFRITTREGHEFAMKPMNCPHHIQIFDRKQWSYRELPQRYCNTTTCYRDEQTGELSGLSRVRSFTQDDAHVFCRMTQVKEEFLKVWDIVQDFYGAFGFDMRVRLSIHDSKQPEKYLGDKKKWEGAESILREIVTAKDVNWFEGLGEAAFYGPKLDFMAKDAIGREWQVATIQLDMNQPERFDLFCINEKGEQERIVMLHAAIMGSIDR